jgi:ABC-type transport system involved in cytochrome c biogenesis permease subunit
MHDHPLNQQNLSPDEMEHLEQRLIRALETVPEPHISSDFAARVASRLPAERPVSLTPTHYGQKAMLIGILATLATLLALALHATGRPSFGLVESFLFTQFVVLVVWLSVWRHSLR